MRWMEHSCCSAHKI